MLTVCYVTARRDNHVRWFFDSLHRELGARYDDTDVVVVDFWAEAQRPGEGWNAREADARRAAYPPRFRGPAAKLRVVPPAPNVWQGPFRRTRENFYAKSNALNTAVLHARGDHLLFLDDLGVLAPGFFGPVREARRYPRRISCFAFDKHDAMEVSDGRILRSRPRQPRPQDDRLAAGSRPRRIAGPAAYGGALVVPMDVALAIDGWPQDCDGMRSQDSAFGLVAANAGFEVFYDPRAMVVEGADRHSDASVVMRGASAATIGGKAGGKTRKAVFLERCKGLRRFANYYGPGGLRARRKEVLQGGPVPRILEPRVDWFSRVPLEKYEAPRTNNELARTA